MQKMLFRVRISAIFLTFSLAFSPYIASAQVVPLDTTSTPSDIATSTPEVIIKYKGTNDLSVVDVAPNVTTDALVEHLNSEPSVEYAEPNYQRRIFDIATNDPYRNLEWGLDNTGQTVSDITGTAGADINAPEAWSISLGTSTVVAVIDVGVDYRHPDIANQMWDGSSCVSESGASISSGCNHGYDFADGDNDPLPPQSATDDTAFHGTHVAGIIAAEQNNSRGISGVAPEAKIMAIRFGLDVASEVEAIDFARENGAKIINASYGGTEFSQAEYDAIKRFTDAGGIFIAAAGNDSTNNDGGVHTYPSDYDLPNIISVAATDSNDGLASFSNYGPSSVDVGAPGANILSLYPDYSSTTPAYKYAYADGTSMATPMTVGEAALIWSYKPSLTSDEVRSLIESSGDPLPSLSGKTISGKRIDAYGALLALSTSTTAVLTGLPNATSTDAVPGLNVEVSGEGATYYKYKLDTLDWSATTTINTPITASGLTNGTHSLSVIAGTAYGYWQSTSTDYSWIVDDTTAPEITGLADDTSGVMQKTWTWSSSDPSATYAFVVNSTTTPETLPSFASATRQ